MSTATIPAVVAVSRRRGPVPTPDRATGTLVDYGRPARGHSTAEEIFELLEHLRPDWHADAACTETPQVNFFPQLGEPAAPALAVCASCLVRDDCLEWALTQGALLAGVWGGTTQRGRRARVWASRH